MAMDAAELGRRLAQVTNEALTDASAVQAAGLAVSLIGAGLHLCDEMGIDREYAVKLASSQMSAADGES